MPDRSVTYTFKGNFQGLSAGLTTASRNVGEFGGKLTALDRDGAKMRAGLTELGNTAGKFGLVAAAGLGAVITKAANFDQAMSNVQAATMESARNMELLRQAALDAGADTVFSATESAAAIEELSKAGVSTADILAGGLQGALDLAAAGQLDVAAAAEYTATALNQFSLEGDQATHVADLLAAGAGKAQGEVSDMANALNYAGVPAANLGVTIEETAGAVALLASNGIIGEQAGTSLRGMLASLTSPSKVAAGEMEALGIEVFDAQGKFVGFEGVAGQLQQRMGGLTDAERAYSLGKIFGNEQLQAANVLYREGADGVRRMTAEVDDQGYAAEAASTRLDNLKGDIEQLGGALETALIGTGDGAQGGLRTLTQSLTRVVDIYNELPSSAKTATAAVLGGSAALGGSIWVGSKLVRGIADTREAMEKLGVAGPKAIAAVKGLAAAAAAAAAIGTLVAAVDALSRTMDESLPGAEKLQGRLIDLANIPDGFSVNIGTEFDSLGDSIDRLADPSRWQKIDDTFGRFNDAILPGQDLGDRPLREAKAEIEALDVALAQLASGGNAEIAAASLERLTKEYGLSKSQVDSLTSLLPQYDEALAGVDNQAKLAASSVDSVSSASGGLSEASKYSAEDLKVMQKALDDARKAAQGVAEQYFSVGSAVNDAEGSLDKFLASLEQQANALVKVRENAKLAAKNGIRKGLIRELEEAGPAGAVILEKLANSTETEIGRANAAYGKGKRAINNYVDATVKVPKALRTELDVTGVPQAISNIDRIRNALAQVRDKSVTIRVTQSGTAANTPGFGPQANAEGGYISGPGTGTSDSIPSYLSNGEYVIKAAAVSKYGTHMFDRLNAMHFAQGGSVGRRGAFAGPGVGPEAIEILEAIKAVRDLQRELNKSGKNRLSGLDRQIAQAQLAAAKAELDAIRNPETAAKDPTSGLQQSIVRLTETQAAQTQALEAATAEQEFWAGKMTALSEATTSRFQTGLFDRDSNPWADGAGGGALFNLNRDIEGLRDRAGIQSQLASMGLSGEVLTALLSQGTNADLSGAIQRGEIPSIAALIQQRADLTTQVGGAAGQAAYGKEFAAASQQREAMIAAAAATAAEMARQSILLERMQAQLDNLNTSGPERIGAEVRRAVDSKAAQGQRVRVNTGGRW